MLWDALSFDNINNYPSISENERERLIEVVEKKMRVNFPNTAKNILEYLKDNPVCENSIFRYVKPKNYAFDFKKTPDQTISELFGHDSDAKLANILYVGQIPEKDIQNLESNKSLYNKVLKTIKSQRRLQFKNEIFSISKIR